MTTPVEREFAVFRRGEQREAQLRDLREGLRLLIDPDTGQPFTDDVLRRATARGGRFWREADAIDLILMGVQKGGEFFAQQTRIDRSGSSWLRQYHSPLWGEPYLPAFGGSGFVNARGLAGTTWLGSTTIPDPFAQVAADTSGLRYQVVLTGTADANGNAQLVLLAIDGGTTTNLAVDSVLKWVSPPPGSEPTVTVVGADFTGGQDAETDADFSKRLAARVRHKPASGNWAHLRSYARAASVSVEDAFVYPAAFHAGSELVVVTQKRGDVRGPLARAPSFGTLQAVTAALVPPASPFVPGRVHVVVLPPQLVPSDMVVRLAQPLGSAAGWTDLEPFPPINGTDAVTVTTVTTTTVFQVTCDGAGLLPQGVAGPLAGVHLMAWNQSISSFERLDVSTVEDIGGGIYRVTLATAPTRALQVGDWISPEMARRDTLASAVSAYFDGLGPGEVIDLENDERGARAYRHPVGSEEYPTRAGQSAISVIGEALGAPVSDAQLASVSVSAPSLPTDPIDGPNLIVAGNFAVYPLT